MTSKRSARATTMRTTGMPSDPRPAPRFRSSRCRQRSSRRRGCSRCRTSSRPDTPIAAVHRRGLPTGEQPSGGDVVDVGPQLQGRSVVEECRVDPLSEPIITHQPTLGSAYANDCDDAHLHLVRQRQRSSRPKPPASTSGTPRRSSVRRRGPTAFCEPVRSRQPEPRSPAAALDPTGAFGTIRSTTCCEFPPPSPTSLHAALLERKLARRHPDTSARTMRGLCKCMWPR